MQSVTLEVVHRHEKLAPESGVEFVTTVSEACDQGLTHNTFCSNSVSTSCSIMTLVVLYMRR